MISRPQMANPVSGFESIDDEDGSLLLGAPSMNPIVISSGTGARNGALTTFFANWPEVCRFVKLSDRSFAALLSVSTRSVLARKRKERREKKQRSEWRERKSRRD